ncbi:hypothetical protein GE061_003224 [Apolygus lucorum]|uniref:tRNA pseudouridine(55) synthase n=1 Tax=Apolygus lucorum TaxID=248454 RepID=A0A8S9X2X7_APOLU|nr:hypothetical protein GE061_003224 [Apolygus lucorum]
MSKGTKNIEVCRKFGIPSSTVSTLWRDRQRIMEELEDVSPYCKRARKSTKDDLDSALMAWIKTDGQRVVLSGKVLKVQAERIAADLGHVDFNCSQGWLQRFRTRHNISCGKFISESAKLEREWLETIWNAMRSSYVDEDVYAAHEVGLFFDVTPQMMKDVMDDKCHEGQHAEGRLTIMLCCNMNGTDKRPLAVVGSTPVLSSYFENVSISYFHNAQSWMTREIFEKEMFTWDEELRQANRNILVLVDSCSAHAPLTALENIRLCFLPRYAPGLQPIERGICQSFRRLYRRQILVRLLDDLEAGKSQKLTPVEALSLVHEAWRLVECDVIKKAFENFGLSYGTPTTSHPPEPPYESLSQWMKEQNKGTQLENLDLFEYFDEGLSTCIPDIAVITCAPDVSHAPSVDLVVKEERVTSGETELGPDQSLTTVNDAKEALRILSCFFEQHSKKAETSLALDVLNRNVDDLGVDNCEKEEANLEEEDAHSNKLAKPNPCVGCLGLLQKPYSNSLIHEIIQGAHISEYDAKTFNVSMNLPSCYLLRSEALLVELRKHFPAFYEENFDGQALLSLKDTFKACFGHQLGATFSLKLDLSSGFVIHVDFKYDADQDECKPLCSLRPQIFTRHYVRKNGYTKNRIESILDNLDCVEFSKTFRVPPAIPSQVIKIVKVNVARESTNVAGRYNKYCRDLPQTPWLLNGERKMESSVEELISGPIVALLGGSASKFASSGREDVDVRSLGRGRPFNVEVVMPKISALRNEQLRALEKEITEKSEGKLRVRDLQIVARESLVTLKQGEEEKTKEYSALCFCPGGIPDCLEEAAARAPLVLDQSTPIRVLHRRPVAVRQKEILEMSVTRLEGDKQKFILNLKTQAGTYIKEFIHGDFSRTKPSFGDLLGGVQVDILALDVTDIALDWPPSVSYDDTKSNGKH